MDSIEEKLIELVRSHPVLYNTSEPNYMKIKLKQEIWTTIANEVNLANGKYDQISFIVYKTIQ